VNDDPLDHLVREHLEREAATVDASAMLRRVQKARRFSLKRWSLRIGAGAVAAAAMVFFILWSGSPNVVEASPEQLVRDALATHSQIIDRRYTIETEWEPHMGQRFPLLALQRNVRLWTRGDRFWIDVQGPHQHFAWGRDESGRVWLVPNRFIGLVYEPEELTEPVHIMGDVCSMRVETILNDVLANFDLTRESSTIITARPKNGPRPGGMRFVRMELDAQSKSIRHIEIERMFRGEFAARVVATLQEESHIDDCEYELRGHLAENGKIVDGGHAWFRQFLLRLYTGTRPGFGPTKTGV